VSPIRPENRSRYPADWPAISLAIKERAGWQCECEGECGRGTHKGRCPNRHGEPAYGTGSKVVLTTAHLDHVPERVDPANLRAMCQGCHLHYDREHHAQTAARTRAEAATAGMDPMFEVAPLFLASRSIRHPDDGKRRVLAVGRTKGGSALVQVCARFGDLVASGRRPGRDLSTEDEAGIEAVKRAGRQAWDKHHGGTS
jgi:hypothetical protein